MVYLLKFLKSVVYIQRAREGSNLILEAYLELMKNTHGKRLEC